ncbi:hypothetical protein CCYA_CCYA10G2862 [Cyanidiococcus yangmingshanensis]|nr:hypothetical protein CCYA_CCYA10G2862 [Cyanidiococcus yangmingshanensis]
MTNDTMRGLATSEPHIGARAGSTVATTSPEQQHWQEESLRRKYGNLPNKRDILQRRLRANHLHERKFYDSADATLAKAGRESVDQVGEDHPYVPPGLTPLTRRGLNGSHCSDQNHSGSSSDEGGDVPVEVAGATPALPPNLPTATAFSGDRSQTQRLSSERPRENSITSSASSVGSAVGLVPLRRSAEVQRSELPPVAEPSSVLHWLPDT